ncbi:MAG: hypothetical protein ABI113_10160 [Mucilaginibacter sp.]
MRVGNKINSFLNGEWAKHARPFGKKRAASKRRALDKKEINSSENYQLPEYRELQ